MNARVVRVGPFAFLLRSSVPGVIAAVDRLYRNYPDKADDGIVDYTVAVEPTSLFRRLFRPKVELACDIEIPFMAPQPAAHAPLALEMGMNLQIAAGMHRYLLLHAGAVARDDDALLLLGDSGAGKSTLTAMLGWSGWRFLGDELTLVDPATGALHPFPRPASLKNSSIDLLAAHVPESRFGPVFEGTIKGRVRHLLPPTDAIAAMDRVAQPRLILALSFEADAAPESQRMGVAECFARLTAASTNCRLMGETGFDTAYRLASETPAYAVRYPSTEAARTLIDRLWADHA